MDALAKIKKTRPDLDSSLQALSNHHFSTKTNVNLAFCVVKLIVVPHVGPTCKSHMLVAHVGQHASYCVPHS